MNPGLRVAICVAGICVAASLDAQRPASFVERSLTWDGVSYRYQVFVPQNHDTTQRWPDRIRAIVVFPQAPTDTIWNGVATRVALRALDEAIHEFRGDSDRVYLTGLSMGAYGTWQLALEHHGRFAALVPIGGGVRQLRWAPQLRVTAIPDTLRDPYAYVAAQLRGIPVWIFHNAADPIVPASESRRMATALRRVGAAARYTEYRSVRHDAWTAAYRDPALWRWLFAQKRRSNH